MRQWQAFAQLRGSFDASVLGCLHARLMGVYPPGSLVQLVDGRLAVVMVVGSGASPAPWVVPHQPDVPRSQVALLNLAQTPEFGILRSLKPAQLPRAALEYLLPQPRICYFLSAPWIHLAKGMRHEYGPAALSNHLGWPGPGCLAG